MHETSRHRSPLLTWQWADPVSELSEFLDGGGVVALPTESSYGLGANPRSEVGVEAIYRLKERDRGKPLPLVLASLDQAFELGVDPDDPLLRIVEKHWPAPLTAIVKLRPSQLVDASRSLPAAAGGDTLAIRIPDHRGLRRLLARLGHALTATSANLSGEPALLDLDGLNRVFGQPGSAETALRVIDGGPLPGGAPSTVVSFRAGRVFVERPGRFDPTPL